jgi:hypothetical protein
MILLSYALGARIKDMVNVENTVSRSANPLTSDTRVIKSYTVRARVIRYSERSIKIVKKLRLSTSFTSCVIYSSVRYS